MRCVDHYTHRPTIKGHFSTYILVEQKALLYIRSPEGQSSIYFILK